VVSTTDGTDPARVSALYDDFGRHWAHGTSPLYEEWALGIAGDRELAERIAPLARRLRQPNLLFAAARWAGSPLAPFARWREWLLANWERVLDVARERSTQTNEPNRCATLLPVLSRIDGPVALLEVGAAAGLCLFPDRYSYEYSTPSGIRRLAPTAGEARVSLACRVDADGVVPDRLPEVVWRRGVDLNPIDARDPEEVEWLATLVWPGPDHDARVARLRAAAAVAASDPPDIIRGDLLETVTDAAAATPPEATLVVFHSAVLLYLDAAGRARFADIMDGLAAAVDRRVVWLSNESRGTLTAVDARVPADLDTSQRFIQSVDGVPIALAGQHGATYETAPSRGR